MNTLKHSVTHFLPVLFLLVFGFSQAIVSQEAFNSKNIDISDSLRFQRIREWDDVFNDKYDLFLVISKVVKDKELKEKQRVLLNIHADIINDSSKTDREKIKVLKEKVLMTSWEIFFELLGLNENEYNQARIESYLSLIRQHSTMQYLSTVYVTTMDRFPVVTDYIKERNFQLIQKRLSKIEDKEFVNYKSHNSGRKAIKDFDFFVDNDFLLIGRKGMNQDREYTGGGGLTISTDYFEARWFNFGIIRDIFKKMKEKPHRMMLSYQSVSLKMNFYTPFVRYRDNYSLADTMFQYDRPFGSYVHFDRDKYRLWAKGLVRHHGSFQIGLIGSDYGKDIQALLHRDAVVSSQKVYGWDKQIAQGGRWLLQYNNDIDFLLFSTTNKYRSIFFPNRSPKKKRYFGLNLIGSGELLLGGYLTSYGGGLGFSTNDFTVHSGQKTVRAYKPGSFYDFGFSFETGLKYRHIIHNSLLEGFGYHRTFIDDAYDDESLSVYTLNKEWYEMRNNVNNVLSRNEDKWVYDKTPGFYDQLNRDLFYWDIKVNLRFRKMTLYYQLSFYQKEYSINAIDYRGLDALVKQEDKNFFYDTVVKELDDYNSAKFYGYGRVGLTWILDY